MHVSDGLRPTLRSLAVALILAGGPIPLRAGTQPDSQDLKQLTLEQLMEIDVTLTARRPEPMRTAAAAISVITAEDIRRAGVTTVADALTLAEGVHVARVSTGTWAITARGFNSATPNKLLVMIDRRTVYSPLFAGVFWNSIDYVLADIDRIEVIRGPGASLWGGNAVNGVINIVTRSARETHGARLSLTSGNEDPAIVEARYGAGRGNLHWRAYGKFARRDDQRLADGSPARDSVARGQSGFRVDGGAPGGDMWTVKGDLFHSALSFADRPDGELTDINMQAMVSRVLSPTSRVDAGTYYRREYRRVPNQLTHHIDVFDLDLQHTWTALRRHQVVWGGAFRVNVDRTHGSPTLRFDPAERTYPLSSLFAQDEFALVPERFFVAAGIKVERNAFSGTDWQPNVRARWMLPRRQMLWGSVARAVRRPTRLEDDIVVTTAAGVPTVRGSDDFVPEKLTSVELGYRAFPVGLLSLDATVFTHGYDEVRSQEAPVGAAGPVVFGNSLNGRSAGVELGMNVQPVSAWRTQLGYTYLDTEITRDPGSRDVSGGAAEANDPRHILFVRMSLTLGRGVELDALVRHVGSLPNPVVPKFTEMNARAAWRPTPRLEFALVGQDLLNGPHPEFGPATPFRQEFERSVRAQVTVAVP